MMIRTDVVKRCLALVSICALYALCADTAIAVAEDAAVYHSGGRAYGLIRSDTEFAIEMKEGETIASVTARALGSTGGVIKPVPWGRRNGRFAILEVPVATAKARRSARMLAGVRTAHRVYRFSPGGLPVLASGELVAKLSEGMTAAQRDAFLAEYGVEIVRPANGLRNWYVLRPVDPEGDEVAIAAAMYEDGRTIYAHPNFRSPKVLRQTTPDDAFFDQQWHLQNTGQSGGLAGADIDVLNAWTETQGQDVRVGMFDDSCDVSHEDLLASYLGTSHDPETGEEGATMANPRDIGDLHGTLVMGLICAAPNTLGVRGVAPLSQFTASRGLSDFLSNAQTAAVYTYARQQSVDVHNNSWGYWDQANPDIVVDAIRTAFEEGRDGLGMVVVFASGNMGEEIFQGFELSTLSTVVGVGASNAIDALASYSNYGEDIDVLAPSGDDFLPGMATTDNSDDAGFAEPGLNYEGNPLPDLLNRDYTKLFSGTSASCPVAVGVAALILSANPDLTVTQVRSILEHTAEKIAPDGAGYHGITSRSLEYGYGRINAAEAVTAAAESRTNGGLTWPERVTNVTVDGNALRWSANDDLRDNTSTEETEELGDKTVGTLVVQKIGEEFQWIPTDGGQYTIGEEVADGVTVVVVPGAGATGQFDFDDSGGETLYFAIFAQNGAGRYSWGVAVDSLGSVFDPGPIDPDVGGGGGGDDDGILAPPGSETPKVSISVSPLNGESPLSVSFRGNAQTDSEIETTLWNFGDGGTDSQRTTDHTYAVAAGTNQTFEATFTVTDTEGDEGSRSILINVKSSSTSGQDADGSPTGGTLTIVVEVPGSVGSDVDTGDAPFTVQLSVDTSDVPGTLKSIVWDLGDGTTANSLSVPHTYSVPGIFPLTVTVTTVTTSGTEVTTTATRLITVTEGTSTETDENGSAGTGGASAGAGGGGGSRGLCGLGILMPFVGLLVMSVLRRRLS